MSVYIKKGICSGSVKVPPSKSLSHRVLLASFLSKSKCKISNLLLCDDTIATMGIMKSLGKEIIEENNEFIISGDKFNYDGVILNANESGSTLRFIIPILSLFPGSFKITGTKKLLSRPLDIYKKIYNEQGLVFDLTDNCLEVSGKLASGEYVVPGNISSQFITGLLYTLPLLNGDSRIVITEKFESKSYVDMTLEVLKKFGIVITLESENVYFIKGNQEYKACDITVEGDYSQMAFWGVLGTINNDLKIEGMNEYSLQGDSEIVNILDKYANNIKYVNDSYFVSKNKISKMEIDLSMIPDLGPILAVLCCSNNEYSVIKNCYRLKYKESDRLEAIKEELLKMNIDVKVIDDTLMVKNKGEIYNTEIIDSHNDHRIFMALAILGTISENGVRIDNEGCINKSYPNFLNDLINVGIKVEYE